jgi:hypothetical protein
MERWYSTFQTRRKISDFSFVGNYQDVPDMHGYVGLWGFNPETKFSVLNPQKKQNKNKVLQKTFEYTYNIIERNIIPKNFQ